MNAEVENTLREVMASMRDVAEARQRYIEAIATAKSKSGELSTLLETIINQPHIDIDDYELDG
jgi:hypothetical protein